MEKRFRQILIAALVVLFVQGGFTLFWLTRHKNKTAYINTEAVYNSFEMKNQLEKELKKTSGIRQHILDSMRLQLDMISMRLQDRPAGKDSALSKTFRAMRENYFQRQEEYRQADEAQAKEYTDQVWTQLNAYIKEYGTNHGYQYIFGANGDGALMFADDAVNITDDLQAFVNQRFKGQS